MAIEQPRDGEHVKGAADENSGDGGDGEAEVPPARKLKKCLKRSVCVWWQSRVLADKGAHAKIRKHDGFSYFSQQPRQVRHAYLHAVTPCQ